MRRFVLCLCVYELQLIYIQHIYFHLLKVFK